MEGFTDFLGDISGLQKLAVHSSHLYHSSYLNLSYSSAYVSLLHLQILLLAPNDIFICFISLLSSVSAAVGSRTILAGDQILER